MSIILGILAALLAVVWVVCVADIVRRRLSPARTAAWILLVLILPVLGAILYWTLRTPTPEEARRQAEAAREQERHRHAESRRSPF